MVTLGESKFDNNEKAIEGDIMSLVKFVASNEREVQDSRYSYVQLIIMTGPLDGMSHRVQKVAKCLATDRAAPARKRPDGSWIPAKVNVKFYHVGNEGEDGIQRDMYDSEVLPFYEGLCVRELDPKSGLPLGNGLLPLPAKGANVQVGPGRPKAWRWMVWSPKQPGSTVNSVPQQKASKAATTVPCSTAGQATKCTKRCRPAQSAAIAGTKRSRSGEFGDSVRSLLSGQATVKAAQVFGDENLGTASGSAAYLHNNQPCEILTASEEQRYCEFSNPCM